MFGSVLFQCLLAEEAAEFLKDVFFLAGSDLGRRRFPVFTQIVYETDLQRFNEIDVFGLSLFYIISYLHSKSTV